MNTKLFITTIICIISTLLLLSCNQAEEIPFDTVFKTKHSLLSVSEAQQLFEVYRPKETTRSPNKKLYPFTIGDYVIPDCAGPHLHIEVWKNGVPIDPEPFFCTQFDENGKPIE